MAAARMGVQTLLVTGRKDAIARMPCNPSIGGLAKSHLVYELDALGGEMGFNADQTALQEKTLNTSRGPAVRATRAQCDKKLYAQRMQEVVARQPNLTVLEDAVTDLLVHSLQRQDVPSPSSPIATTPLGGSRLNSLSISGIRTEGNGEFSAQAVVVTSGTALRGRIFIGHEVEESGGDGRPAANRLSGSLERLGFHLIRLKTGTPPRLKASSCDFTKCLRQDGEVPPPLFSLRSRCSTWNERSPSKADTMAECSTWNNGSGVSSECSTWNIPNIPC